jgi:phytanoyl-CoA hydroxylase
MLSSELVNQFHRDGFCSATGILPDGELIALLENLESISAGATAANHDSTRMEMEPDQAPDGTAVRRIYEPCTHYPRFRVLSESRELLDSVAQLLGENLLFHYSKINMKPPLSGSVVEWHQDLAYHPLTNSNSLAVLFYLDNADRRNGCLRVIPGMHRTRILDHTSHGYFRGRITECVDESGAVAIEGSAGTAIFLHGMTPHASAPNTSQWPRRTLILGYRAADAFPIFVGETTLHSERYVRQVRGANCSQARLAAMEMPIPRYETVPKSLYELQQRFREQEAAQRSL